MPIIVFFIAIVLFGSFVKAQFPEDTKILDQAKEIQQYNLEKHLKNILELEDVYFPAKYLIPKSYYRFDYPEEYRTNVIFDPCRGNGLNCCNDTFGSSEFIHFDTDKESRTYGSTVSYDSNNRLIKQESSRSIVEETFIDVTCTGLFQPNIRCYAKNLARRRFRNTPFCWNYNSTIDATAPCRSPHDGSYLPLCIEVGYTQNSYIFECGNQYRNDPHCGTFLEIHKPNSRPILPIDDNGISILAATKLKGQFTSGYRMTLLSTTYQRNNSRVLCQGDYEVWWVQRTRSDFVVQNRVPFRVVNPACDWDGINNRFMPYATVNPQTFIDSINAEVTIFSGYKTSWDLPSGVHLDMSNLRQIRERTSSSVYIDGKPGRGMGSTVLKRYTQKRGVEAEYPKNAKFNHGNDYSFTYSSNLET